METVARFHKGEEAYLFRSYLESEGIQAFVFDEHFPQLWWLYTQAIGGIRVVVDVDVAEQAADLYSAYEKAIATGPNVVGDVKAWPAVLLVSLVIGVPFLLLGREIPEAFRKKP